MIESQITFSEEEMTVLKESADDYDLHTTSHVEPVKPRW